jgi:hypothetical protein
LVLHDKLLLLNKLWLLHDLLLVHGLILHHNFSSWVARSDCVHNILHRRACRHINMPYIGIRLDFDTRRELVLNLIPWHHLWLYLLGLLVTLGYLRSNLILLKTLVLNLLLLIYSGFNARQPDCFCQLLFFGHLGLLHHRLWLNGLGLRGNTSLNIRHPHCFGKLLFFCHRCKSL